MRLRQRTLVILLVTAASLVAATSGLSQFVLGRSFTELERQHVEQDVSRTLDAIKEASDDVHGKSIDWSEWDDTYKFMADKNPAYIESNLSTVSLEIDAILYVGADGKLFYSRSLDRIPGTKSPDAAAVYRQLRFDRPLAERPGKGRAACGIIEHQGALTAFSVRPIMTTAGTGPARGWIVFVRYFDGAFLGAVSRQVHLPLRLLPGDRARLSESDTKALDGLEGHAGRFVAPIDEFNIAGYTLVKDVFGKNVRILKIIEPRSIYLQGQRSTSFLTEQLAVVAFAFTLVTLFALEASVLRRLTKLTQEVDEITDETDVRIRVGVTGQDEITSLSSKINSLLESLGRTHESLKDSEDKLRQSHDGLERKILERTEDLRRLNESLQFAVEGIAIFDSEGKCVKVNSAFERILGFESGEMTSDQWNIAFDPSQQAKVRVGFLEACSHGKAEFEAEARTKSGDRIFVEIVLVASGHGNGQQGFTHVFMKDITDRKVLELELERQAFQDNVTRLPNRLLFLDRLNHGIQMLRRKTSGLCVMFLDLDNFKVVNDSLGHDAGDTILVEVAARLQDCVRPGDTVARWGGDEFVLLLEDLPDADSALHVVHRIAERLRAPIRFEESEIYVSASIGIRHTDSGDTTTPALLRDADTAMYHAKGSGKSTFAMFEPSMNMRAVERLEIETGLRQALVNDEFEIVYQPLIGLAKGEIQGVEALLRWRHPSKGLIPPGLFIPIAEETGSIISIGAWVLEQACRQVKTWQSVLGLPDLGVSVNLSGKQLQRPDIVETVSDVLHKTGLEPRHLKLEITESVLIENVEEANVKLVALRDLGVLLAIDDFGTGYSSMASLGNFPLDTVKIDRSFVSQLDSETKAVPIISAILMLSEAMNLDVTAEGLESLGQVEQLRDMGCTTGQGYHLAKPMSAEDFARYVQDQGSAAA
ncbi:MAG: EAL domain-containing protein [Armatimonadetes bacterium]|nr:EAL domain-containing protein [Armatimonadota bacterium]